MGLECTREVVRLRRVVSQNGREIAFLDSLRGELEGAAANPARVAQVLRRLSDRVLHLQSGQMPPDGRDLIDSSAGDDASLHTLTADLHVGGGGKDRDDANDHIPSHISRRSHAKSQKGDQDAQDSLIVTALEHIAWGRNSGSCYPHRRCACQYNTHGGPGGQNIWQHIPYMPVASRIITEALPSRSLSEALVHFHVHHVAWHHSSLHIPTFLEQCNRFWSTGLYEHPQWLALYLAVLSTAQFCLLHSSKYYRDGQFVSQDGTFLVDLDDSIQEEPSHPRSSQSLFQAMMDVLHESQYLQNVSLHCVQAVVISTEVAHNLGLSQLNATLFAAAVRIAECLGIHKIESEDDDDDDDRKDRDTEDERLDREIGRRVWLQMVVQDHFAMPFTDAYGIHPQQYATGDPRNCDDGDRMNHTTGGRLLLEKADDLPTISSYNRVLATLARLVPELADGLGPLRARKSLQEQYEHILTMDRKMRQVVRSIPSYFLREEPALEAQVPWLGIARQSMAITAAEKIIMVHRPFLFRSFQAAAAAMQKKDAKSRQEAAAYQHTRRTCVSAAMTILREHRNITAAGEVSLWTHTAFCITAALLLSFEVLCTTAGSTSSGDDDDEVQRQIFAYHNAIQYARAYLASRRHDVLAQRGVLLIDTLFPSGTESLSGSSLGAIPQSATAPATGTAASPSTPAGSLRFDDIVSKFTVGWAMVGLTADWQQQQRQQQQHQQQQQQQQQAQQVQQARQQRGLNVVPTVVDIGTGYEGPIPNLNLPSQATIFPSPTAAHISPQTAEDDYGAGGARGVAVAVAGGGGGGGGQGFPVPDTMVSSSPSLEDFDAWFQHIFSTGRGPEFGQAGGVFT